MKRKVFPDVKKAQSLKEMAKTILERLNSFNKLKYPSNTLNDYYNILHNLMEAVSISEGVKFSGDSAHKELIDWICLKLKYSEQKKVFLQQLRDYRNKISYEGFFIKENFIKQNDKKILTIIAELGEKLEE